MIEICKGNTHEIYISLVDNTKNEYRLQEGDTLLFGVKSEVSEDNYLLFKTLTPDDYDINKNSYVIKFEPEDTFNLSSGDYYYDVGIETASGEFYTVISIDTFRILTVITRKTL